MTEPRAPSQPGSVLFEEEALVALTDSIRELGVLQPILVRPVPGSNPSAGDEQFELIAGERRWRAARQAGLDRIPAIVRDATDAQSIELALVEKLLREDLNPIETLFAKLKHWLRKAAARTPDAVCDAISHILDTVTASECSNYLIEAGYARPKLIPL